MILYGIPNCDTVKKARAWLTTHDFVYRFHDFKKDGVDPVWLGKVEAQLGWQTLLNTRGTTWRKLDEARRARVVDAGSALALLCEHPSAIKRPVLEHAGRYHAGFSDTQYQDIFKD
jgi:Spx/MgsR family transcriptional regulator